MVGMLSFLLRPGYEVPPRVPGQLLLLVSGSDEIRTEPLRRKDGASILDGEAFHPSVLRVWRFRKPSLPNGSPGAQYSEVREIQVKGKVEAVKVYIVDNVLPR